MKHIIAGLLLHCVACDVFALDLFENLKSNIHTQSEQNPECRNDDILGYWLTPKDEQSGRSSIVEFIKKDGRYFAYNVVFMDSLPGGKDERNQTYALRDRDVLGSVFIYNLEKNMPHSYVKGRYYDFNVGKTFYLRAKLECNDLVLIISVDNVGMLGNKKKYKYIHPEDIDFYIRDKIPAINFNGVD